LGAAEGACGSRTNGGTTWTALTDSQPSLAVGSIAIDPTNSQTIYVGTGEGDNATGDGYYGAGILKSTNGAAPGLKWAVAISPRAPRVKGYLATLPALI